MESLQTKTELLRASHVAQRASISLAMAYKLIASGMLPSIRMGRSVRVPRAALERWIETNTTGGMDAA